jgi:hypothetical protein
LQVGFFIMKLFNSPRLRQRRDGLDQLYDIVKDKSRSFIIHYSCESFVTTHGKTPRVTSICINNLKTSQTNSFSIHLQAQFEGVDFNDLSEKDYDGLELGMLTEFTNFVKDHPTSKWVHWNMRDSNYGFLAINNRLRILNGSPYVIPDDRKYDLPRILQLLYTNEYEQNRPKGRLLNLAERNGVTTNNAMTGKEEADAFDNKEYLKLHISTLRKVDIIQVLIIKTEVGELKTAVGIKTSYGLSVPGLFVLIRDTPWLLFIFTCLGAVLGKIVDILIQKYL